MEEDERGWGGGGRRQGRGGGGPETREDERETVKMRGNEVDYVGVEEK